MTRPKPDLVMPHEFEGRSDRPCVHCYLSDRHSVHKVRAGVKPPEVKRLEVPWDLSLVVEREEPHTYEELAREVDIRVDALRRGRTDWGCDGQHKGNGAPDCPRRLHHHHDPFCREPSPLELRLAGVEKPAQGWGSRA